MTAGLHGPAILAGTVLGFVHTRACAPDRLAATRIRMRWAGETLPNSKHGRAAAGFGRAWGLKLKLLGGGQGRAAFSLLATEMVQLLRGPPHGKKIVRASKQGGML